MKDDVAASQSFKLLSTLTGFVELLKGREAIFSFKRSGFPREIRL